jgi:hypothetical protein
VLPREEDILWNTVSLEEAEVLTSVKGDNSTHHHYPVMWPGSTGYWANSSCPRLPLIINEEVDVYIRTDDIVNALDEILGQGTG